MEWPAWLKCSDTGVSCAELFVIQDRMSVFPKAFIKLTLRLSDLLKVALFTLCNEFIPYFDLQQQAEVILTEFKLEFQSSIP